VTYGDTPPTAAARVETKALTAGGSNTGELPYELSEAVRNHPVTLYTTANCIPCDDARKLLTNRGIPFTEKTVSTNDDIAAFKKISNDGQLPLLVVGRNRERGFETSIWNTALNAAGYPEANKLPKNYRNPPATAAAAKTAAPKVDTQTASEDLSRPAPAATELPPAIGNAPPGFRF
jgi:glutaredoxin